MKTLKSCLATTLVLLSLTARATPVLLFNGTGVPESQGWSVFSSDGSIPANGPEPILSTQNTGTDSDVFSVQTSGTRIHLYHYDTFAGEFLASIRVAVYSSAHNLFDAGFYFSPGYTRVQNERVLGDRSNSIYIDPNGIGFLDGTNGTFSLDATSFHQYSLLLKAGELKVYVDASNDDILSLAAAPVLTRPFIPYDPSDVLTVGIIAFGDMTNDRSPPINSRYSVDFLTLETLSKRQTPVPEPSVFSLFGLGCLCLASVRTSIAKRLPRRAQARGKAALLVAERH